MYDEIVRDIRKQCRLAMNGIASTSMRERGLDYKLNFGLMQQQIKALAGGYEPDAQLAERLWKEETRELKITAMYLYPISEFNETIANKWVNEIPNQEIREQLCMNLFQELPFAEKIAKEWSNSADKGVRTTGYWLLARLYLSKKINETLNLDIFKYIVSDCADESLFTRNAALLVLKQIGRQSEETAKLILEKLKIYKEEDNPIKEEAYNAVAFEFEYFWG